MHALQRLQLSRHFFVSIFPHSERNALHHGSVVVVAYLLPRLHISLSFAATVCVALTTPRPCSSHVNYSPPCFTTNASDLA